MSWQGSVSPREGVTMGSTGGEGWPPGQAEYAGDLRAPWRGAWRGEMEAESSDWEAAKEGCQPGRGSSASGRPHQEPHCPPCSEHPVLWGGPLSRKLGSG